MNKKTKKNNTNVYIWIYVALMALMGLAMTIF